MNATHLLRRAALLTAGVGLVGTGLVIGGGTAMAADPTPGLHHGRFDSYGYHPESGWVRHPRQARRWDDDTQKCNPTRCWRGEGGHGHHHFHHGGHDNH